MIWRAVGRSCGSTLMQASASCAMSAGQSSGVLYHPNMHRQHWLPVAVKLQSEVCQNAALWAWYAQACANHSW